MDLVIELCVCPIEVADQIAREVVKKGLSACVDILPGKWSLLGRQDSPEVNDEVVLLMTTAYDLVEDLCETILELHPSEMPVIVTLAIDETYSQYSKWLQQKLGVEFW
jgi:periplasmic divalent cation tolerance protein